MRFERTWKTMWKTMLILCALETVFVLPAGAQMQRSGDQGMEGITGLSLDQGLLGKDVKMRNGQKIGEIDDVIFSRQGRIAHYLVNVGGFPNAPQKTVALNPNQIQVSGQDHVIFTGNIAELENLPAVNSSAWGYYHQGNGGQGYGYGNEPYGGGAYSRPYYGGGQTGQSRQGQAQGQQQSGFWQQPNPLGQAWGEQRYNQPGQTGRTQQQQMGGTMRRGISGDTLIGARVMNNQNNQIGTIDDFVVDPQKERVTFVGIGFGGWMGIGENHLLVPFNQVRFLDQDTAFYRGNQNQLGQLPQYQVADNGEVTLQNQRAGGSAQSGAQQQGNWRQGGGPAQGRQDNYYQHW